MSGQDSMDVTDSMPHDEDDDDDSIPPGTKVIISGLKAKPELNGELASVESLNDNGRYNVKLASGEILALKPEALQLEVAGDLAFIPPAYVALLALSGVILGLTAATIAVKRFLTAAVMP